LIQFFSSFFGWFAALHNCQFHSILHIEKTGGEEKNFKAKFLKEHKDFRVNFLI